ncbi:SurA N-terminal domain-containing protein [Lentibacillus sp. L22]|uniref:SurA N-terminal domain-containing protein n=1 Tax=Lentibacillus TaxID=175304 RepID=UPI0022B1E6DD|nr:SurA N-terminal domain-containing protein [Lentibacillus daqui]
MKKLVMLVLTLSIVGLLAACGNDSDDSSSEKAKQNDDKAKTEQQEKSQQAQQEEDVTVSDDEKVDKDDVVAQVNDTKIKGEQYNDVYAQTKVAMHQYGQDVSDKDQLKDQAMNVLIQQELVKQDANDKGITVSDDDVDKEFDKMKSQNEDQFQAVLDQYNLSEKGYKNQLTFEMIVDKYMDKELPKADVSNDDVKEYYDQMKEQNEDIPKLKDVKDQIKDQLEQQKQSEELQKKIDKLQKNADVKNMI